MTASMTHKKDVSTLRIRKRKLERWSYEQHMLWFQENKSPEIYVWLYYKDNRNRNSWQKGSVDISVTDDKFMKKTVKLKVVSIDFKTLTQT